MKTLLLTAIAAGLVLTAGCQALRGTPKPYAPRPDQTEWVDETAVISRVTRLIYEARFDSRRAQAERQYAALIRHWYTRVSRTGEDVDAGRRAVRYIHKIHRDAKGSRDLWKQVLSLARQPPPGQDGLVLPDDLR